MAIHRIMVHGSVAISERVGAGPALQPPFLEWARFSPGLVTSPLVWLDTPGEVDWTHLLGLRSKMGATFRGGRRAPVEYAFHFPIPTPGARVMKSLAGGPERAIAAELRRVFLLFDAEEGVQLLRVAVFDGQGRTVFGLSEDVNLTGTHSTEVEEINSWIVGTPSAPDPPDSRAVDSGTVVTAFVRFDMSNQITFRTAGVEFELPDS
jgi:hypothetical protein